MVLWSFYSPDARALSAELAEIRAAVDSPRVRHVAGGVHATAEPVATLDAGWDVAAIGEGEGTAIELVAALASGRDLSTVSGLMFRGAAGDLVRTARSERAPLDRYRAFPVTHRRFNPIEITRGCVNLTVGAQSGSAEVLAAANRGHDVEAVRRAVHIGIAEGFRTNVDIIFGMPGEGPGDVAQTLSLASDLADLGARIHAHTSMPLPGTPWRNASAGEVDQGTIAAVDRMSRRGALYGHWQRQREHATRLAEMARAYPRPGRSRTLPLAPLADGEGRGGPVV